MKKRSNPSNVPALTRSYTQLGDEDLGPELDRYVQGLVGNPRFPDLADQADAYAKLVNDYQVAQAKASSSVSTA